MLGEQSPCLHAEVPDFAETLRAGRRFGTKACHLTNAQAGRHPPPDVGAGPPKIEAFIPSRLKREGSSVAGAAILKMSAIPQLLVEEKVDLETMIVLNNKGYGKIQPLDIT
jgi:hypothetical protein